jgi:adenylylsulfate kinase-like enzyme
VGQDYERPSSPDLVIDGTAPIEESVEKILKILL